MKRGVAFLLAAVLACCFPSCGQVSDRHDGSEGYTFTDDLGRQITVKSAERTAALLGSYADIWYLAGGTVCASADDAWEDFDLPLAEDAVNLGETKNLSLETLFSCEPDFVLASTNTPQHLEWREALEGAGITVAYFDVVNFEDYLRMLKICTDITGKPEYFERYGLDVREQVNEILRRRDGQKVQSVLVMRASAASIRAKRSDATVLGEMLSSFGCSNIADSDSSLLENLSIENILLANPDKIFFIQSGDDIDGIEENVEMLFRENPLWYELDAVKNGRVYYMDKHLYNLKPNARWGEAYEKLEEILYDEP